ncbi:hypothetical protein E2C01_097445 [Portunus trituberculatus]|uniref:Uncharacterized protein n=1 Tax=Portunus trituberculatus TaxID=210409 RepID=A0A5B7K5P9_PORTR|nr:hypothetical protein [Portunus trituberculatus]
MDHITQVTSSITAPHRLYTDGSLQSDGAAGSAVFSPDLQPPPGGWIGRRLRDNSSSTLCELYVLLDAVRLICHRRIRFADLLPEQRRRDNERPHSVTIQHYGSVCRHKYTYRRRGLMVRRYNVVSARLQLGFRPPWQIAGVEGEPPYTDCRLCRAPLSNTIQNYCMECPAVSHLLPQGLSLDAVCRYLLTHTFWRKCY